MTLIDQVKDKLKCSIKSKDVNAKNILRILLGKIQMSGNEDDNSVIVAAKKIIKENQEAILSRSTMPNQEIEISNLKQEISIIESFLPKNLTRDEINSILITNINELMLAPNAGAAVGIAMKILKSYGSVDGKMVSEISSKLREFHQNWTPQKLAEKLNQDPDAEVYIQEILDGEIYYYLVDRVDVMKNKKNDKKCFVIKSRGTFPKIELK